MSKTSPRRAFFYSWSTLTYGLTDWLSAGLVAERTKLVDTDWSLQRGLALELPVPGSASRSPELLPRRAPAGELELRRHALLCASLHPAARRPGHALPGRARARGRARAALAVPSALQPGRLRRGWPGLDRARRVRARAERLRPGARRALPRGAQVRPACRTGRRARPRGGRALRPVRECLACDREATAGAADRLQLHGYSFSATAFRRRARWPRCSRAARDHRPPAR